MKPPYLASCYQIGGVFQVLALSSLPSRGPGCHHLPFPGPSSQVPEPCSFSAVTRTFCRPARRLPELEQSLPWPHLVFPANTPGT